MTIAGKINLAFISVALVLALAFAGFTAWREYDIALQRLVDSAVAAVHSRPELQIDIYQREEAALQQVLSGFVDIPAVFSAVARDARGEVLARRADQAGSASLLPPFKLLRGAAAAGETKLLALDADMAPGRTDLRAAYSDRDRPMYLSVPVFTAIDPNRPGQGPAEFYAASANSTDADESRVVGYVQLDISRTELLEGVGELVVRVLLVSLALIALGALGISLVTRRITRDLSRLAGLAGDVAAGTLDKPVDIGGSGDISEIARVLNGVVGGVTEQKKKTEKEQGETNQEVNESAGQVARRDEELHKAEEEITETKSQLQHMAYFDSLTALPNRRLFTEQLDLLLGLNQRNGHTLALLFLNLDNFKRVNESLGYSAGDQVLLEVGRRIAESLRDSDAVAHFVEEEHKIDVSRLGGDEFTVILNQLESVDSAQTVVGRLLDILQQPMMVDGQEVVVSPSIGVAVAPRDGTDVESLLRAAEVAMHHAKDSARDKFLMFDQQMDATGVGRLKLESELRRAIEREQLVLHYQPQVNTLTGAVSGAEALLRWDHPERGMIPPFQFIPLAEEIGIMGELGDWVLAEACRQLREFDKQDLELPRVALNVSALQFTTAFCDNVSNVLQRTGLDASRLELGLSEDILIGEDREIHQNLRDLKTIGVHLSVDDFGTRYAPLSYLSRYSLDEIKIDRSFALDCARNDNSARLVIAIIAIAKSLGLGVVAEGVETEDQFRFLIDKGAGVMQGYLFAPPVTAAELQQLLAPWHFLQLVQGIQG